MTDDNRAIRVLVVDDDPMASAGLAAILGSAADIEVVGTCGGGDRVTDAVALLRPHVVLCDVRMPEVDGIMVAEELAARSDGVKVLMMTAFDEDGRVLDAVAAGAAGFLMKSDDPTEIIKAVRHVATGEAAYSPRAATQLTEWVRDSRNADARRDALAKMAQLTDREKEFALALVTGATDADGKSGEVIRLEGLSQSQLPCPSRVPYA